MTDSSLQSETKAQDSRTRYALQRPMLIELSLEHREAARADERRVQAGWPRAQPRTHRLAQVMIASAMRASPLDRIFGPCPRRRHRSSPCSPRSCQLRYQLLISSHSCRYEAADRLLRSMKRTWSIAWKLWPDLRHNLSYHRNGRLDADATEVVCGRSILSSSHRVRLTTGLALCRLPYTLPIVQRPS